MLQNIREKLQGWVAVATILVIAVPLVLTFVSSNVNITGSRFAARVNGEEIPTVDFQRAYQNRLLSEQQAALKAGSGQLSPADEDRLKRETLDGLVLNRVVTQYVRDTGFRNNASRVIDQIRRLPVFQVGGQFSKQAYDATLASQGIAPTAFEKEQQSVLALRQLQEGLNESAFFTPVEFRRLIALDQERRDVAYVVLDPRSLGAGINVSEGDVQSFYDSNANQLLTAENANLEYVEVSLADMARDYEPDEEALRKAYDADPTRFRTAEERRARHILIAVDANRTDAAARALAGDIVDKLAKGEDFAALAVKFSSDSGSSSRGGDLGLAAKGTYVEAFEKALFALQPGATSTPVKTEFGYHIIRLDEIRPGAERSFDQVRTELREELRKQKSQDQFYAVAERIDDLALENPTSLAPVAKDTGLPVKHLDGFTRSGGGPFGNNGNLISAVFSPGVLDGSENTPLIELDDTRAVVARVAAHNLPVPRPLDQVRGEIVERLRVLRAITDATTRGNAILQRSQAGEDLGAVATASGMKLVEAGPLTRRSPTLPPDLLAAVFRSPKPMGGKPVVQGITLQTGGFAVFRLNSVAPGEPERIPQEQRDQRKRALAQRTAVGETEALAAHLKETAKVVVAQDLFKAREDEAAP